MKRLLHRFVIIFGILAAFLASLPLLAASAGGAAKSLFNRDVRPILSDNCFHCHGFDANKRKANLRLDTPEGAVAVREGRQALKPGSLEQSDLWRRVNSTDPAVMMPPPESGKKLTPQQIKTLGSWIEQGGAYQKHWAFEPPVRTEPPSTANISWPRSALDRFILAVLESKGLTPAAEAPGETLARRVTLDLTGLSPTPAELDAFLADSQPNAYERLVDRLLSSPRFGEHMARYWLDVARYGDTHGLHLDNERSLWPYRDWVVTAFNENLPFDQFTIWQLAGDLLPNPTREQLIASGFNRCNVSTSEGGAIDEEFQVRYAVDRVETTSAAWMGLTMGCAVCHDHKLDPITQKEFYQVFSIFNNIAEKAMDGNALLPPPSLPLPSPEEERKSADIQASIKSLEAEIREQVANLQYEDPACATNAPEPQPSELVWIDDDFPPGAEVSVNSGNEAHQWVKADAPVFSGTRAILRAGKGLHQTFFTKCDKPLTIGVADKLFAHVYIDPQDTPKAIMLQFHTDQWRHRAVWGELDAIPYGSPNTPEKLHLGALPEPGKWVRLEVEAARLALPPGTRVTGMAFTQHDGKCYWDKAGQTTINNPALDPLLSLSAWEAEQIKLGDKGTAPINIKELLRKRAPERTDQDRNQLRKHYLQEVYSGSSLATTRSKIASLQSQRAELEKEFPATMISKELPEARPAWVLIRGEYDKHGEPVMPGVPAILPQLPPSDATNRLTFARWLVDPQHPLTSRVTVNRFWQQFFGTGLVKTSEDFGTKSEWPSHPELLDWLSTEFIRTGWDMKQLVRLIVTSATYRQDSRVTPRLLEVDPENRLLARGPRHRLDAEVIRDNALFTSSLLNLKVGGRGVRTYQPPGIWEAVGYTTSNTAKYSRDTGDALYRRSLYLFWKRTAPPPSMTTFDAPSREQCRTRRERTNTPLQALLTLNDEQFVEAARHLGHRMLREGPPSDADKLAYGFRLVTARKPAPAELDVLENSLASSRAHFKKDSDSANKLVSVGESPAPTGVPAPELAAFTMVANLLLNLDEVLNKN